jgi:DNA-binding transcriptional ArsR family regulator
MLKAREFILTMKLTVKEYAKQEGISVQTVYAHFKRGSLKSLKENGITYVINDIDEDNSFKDFKANALKSENNLKQAFKLSMVVLKN